MKEYLLEPPGPAMDNAAHQPGLPIMHFGLYDPICLPHVARQLLDALERAGITAARALQGTGLSEAALRSPETRISPHQLLRLCRNASQLVADPAFPLHAGQQFHLSSYGLYGFAILSSTSFRKAIDFAVRYQQLAISLLQISFEEGLRESTWRYRPRLQAPLDPALTRFLVELHLSIVVSLHRDVMGAGFAPTRVRVTYPDPGPGADYARTVGCAIEFDRTENSLTFDSAWLDLTPRMANDLAHRELVTLCDGLLSQMRRQLGLSGRVREALLMGRMAETSCADVAARLHMTERTLRRRLGEERTSFRKLLDELRMELALSYLRQTDLSVAELAHTVGFKEEASLRHAVRRWTGQSPQAYRRQMGRQPARVSAARS